MEWGNPWAFLGLFVLPVLWWFGRARLAEGGPWLARVTLVLRGLFLVLLVCALAQPALRLPEQRTDWLFLVDHSDSVTPEMLGRAMDYLREVEERTAAGDRVAVMSFGADAALDVPFGENLTGVSIGEAVERSATNVEIALQAALAEFEGVNRQRIVLFSDGNETSGDALNIIASMTSRGVKLYSASPYTGSRSGEVVLENLVLPRSAKRGDKFTLEAVIASAAPAEGMLELFEDGQPLAQYRVELQEGRNVFPVDLVAGEEGHRLYEVVINSNGDRNSENNRFQRFLAVKGGSRVLLIYGEEDHSRPLIKALKLQDVRVTAGDMGQLPTTIQGLLKYDVVVFDNAPGFTLSLAQMEIIESYVKDFGGGFVMIGGDKSFGGGGYHETALEKMLPVDMDVASQVKIPSVALLLVIDRSDSMGGYVTESALGGSKLEVAKLASFSAMQLLDPKDRVGLISFDTSAYWSVPMIEVGRREEISSKLAGLEPGGGTDLYVGLKAAIDHLGLIRAYKKHIIALSDGLTPMREFEALVKGAAAHRITLSTVALGDEADDKLMMRLAIWGKGRHYFTNDPMNIPRIFATETTMISRRLVEELDFRPRTVMQHEILGDLFDEELPPLHGYVITTAKPGTEVVLMAPKGDPILVVRRYGLGRSVAFTSDLSMAWGKSWVNWGRYPGLVAQIVRWAERSTTAGSMELEVRTETDKAVVTADLIDDEGRFMNRFSLRGTVSYPDRTMRDVVFSQDAPGHYIGEFPLAQSGEYLLTVSGSRGDVAVGPQSMGLTVPYAAEYRNLDPNTAFLENLARQTGGALLPSQDGPERNEAITEMMAGDAGEFVYKPIWQYLVMAGIFLFLFDVALRQLGWLPGPKEEDRQMARARPIRQTGAADSEAAGASRADEVLRRRGGI